MAARETRSASELRRLTVVVPVYNERNTLVEIVRRMRAVELPDDVQREIIIVDDGSDDGTRDVLKQLADNTVRIVLHDRNRGKGAAVRTGIEHAKGDYVLVQDADLEYDPEDWPKLIRPVLSGKARVVYGSRFTGERRNMLFLHWVGNRFLSLATNVLYNTTLSDMETCYKLVDHALLDGIELRANGFDIEPELTAKLLRRKVRIYEVPISYTGREYSEGKKITWRDGVGALWTLLKYRFPRLTAPRWAAVIVNYEAGPLLAESVRAVLADTTAGPVEIVVVDNGSATVQSASSPRVPRRTGGALTGQRRVHTRRESRHRGNASADRRRSQRRHAHRTGDGSRAAGALRHATPPRCLRAAHQERRRQRLPVGAPRSVDAAGGDARRPRLLVAGEPVHRSLSPTRRGPRAARLADWLSGSAVWLRRGALDAVGGWDERYFMYLEDVDLCWRLRRAGWEVAYEPAGVVWQFKARPPLAVRTGCSSPITARRGNSPDGDGPVRAPLLPFAAAFLARARSLRYARRPGAVGEVRSPPGSLRPWRNPLGQHAVARSRLPGARVARGVGTPCRPSSWSRAWP